MKELKKYYVCWCGSSNNEDAIYTTDDLTDAVDHADTRQEMEKWTLRNKGIRIDTTKDWVEVREVKSIDADGIDDYEVVFSYNPNFKNYYDLELDYNFRTNCVECTAYVYGVKMRDYDVECDPDYTVQELFMEVVDNFSDIGIMKDESENNLKDMLKTMGGIKEKLEEDDNA